jgi:uncharacterized membrane protein YgcG
VAAGEFTATQRHEIDKAIRAAEQACRYEFSVFIGQGGEHPREFAQRLHGSLVVPDRSVLIMVDPAARAIEVVTGAEVRRTLADSEVALAVLAMQTAFAAGDIVGGLKQGIAVLADHARAPQTLHAPE